MNYANTVRNWRWWVALPFMISVVPIILIDLVSTRAIAPTWVWFCEITRKAFNRVLRWVRDGARENQR